ncbi:hypothetical protein Q1695_005252 [Nippostrongylus brasiliensis]|nr:hypothetical protein Q1695_005252 [Nippostrongylus brasiliensis]
MYDPKVEDLRLPMAMLSRIMKSALPNGAAVSKDARTHVMRACSVFILYILSQAEEHASSKKRKTVNVDDIMHALGVCGFESLCESLHAAFESYKASRPTKVAKAKGPRKGRNPSVSDTVTSSNDQGSQAIDIEDMIAN